jgi:predicted CXXCH cytochrome family protein
MAERTAVMPRLSRWAVSVAALACVAQEESAILAPPNHAAFDKGPVRIIARSGEIKVDGAAVKVESPVSGMATASLELAPGPHEVSVGKDVVRVFVGAGAPTGFKPFRPHPAMASCDNCHAVKDGEWVFKRASLATVCSRCHARDKFPAKHTHEMGVLADCQICHDPHGSTEVGHMKRAKEVACKQCHN